MTLKKVVYRLKAFSMRSSFGLWDLFRGLMLGRLCGRENINFICSLLLGIKCLKILGESSIAITTSITTSAIDG